MESGKRWKDEDIPKTVYPGSPSSARPAVLLSLSGDGPLPRARQLGLLEG